MTLRMGIIGTGFASDKLLAPGLAKAKGANLWSVLSRDPAKGQDFAARHAAQSPRPVHNDLAAMLADPDLDAVYIGSPDKLHASQAIAAAEAGKHVLLEKPMATSIADGERMIEAFDKAGLVLAIAYHMRWHLGHRAIWQRSQEGDFGTLRHMRVIWPTPQRNADGWRAKTDIGRWWSLAAVGTHCLDQVLWYMGETCGAVTEFKAVTTNAGFGSPRDETAMLALKFENGATAEVTSSILFSGPRRMEVFGSGGYALFENTLGPGGTGSIETHDGPFAFETTNPFTGEVEDFARAIREGGSPEVDGKMGMRNVTLLLRAVEAE